MSNIFFFSNNANKAINQSLQTVRGPPDTKTNVIAWPSADIQTPKQM